MQPSKRSCEARRRRVLKRGEKHKPTHRLVVPDRSHCILDPLPGPRRPRELQQSINDLAVAVVVAAGPMIDYDPEHKYCTHIVDRTFDLERIKFRDANEFIY